MWPSEGSRPGSVRARGLLTPTLTPTGARNDAFSCASVRGSRIQTAGFERGRYGFDSCPRLHRAGRRRPGGDSEQVLGHELEDLAVCGDLVRELDDAVTLVLEDQQLGPSYRLGDLDALADRHARVVPAVDDK